jgi:hypothetical protein
LSANAWRSSESDGSENISETRRAEILRSIFDIGIRMDHFYRHHIIRARGGLNVDIDLWTPEFVVSWNQDSKTITKEVSLKINFVTEQEAEQHALEFAKKWIDDGKPKLPAS